MSTRTPKQSLDKALESIVFFVLDFDREDSEKLVAKAKSMLQKHQRNQKGSLNPDPSVRILSLPRTGSTMRYCDVQQQFCVIFQGWPAVADVEIRCLGIFSSREEVHVSCDEMSDVQAIIRRVS